jgi:hypothetical protein
MFLAGLMLTVVLVPKFGTNHCGNAHDAGSNYKSRPVQTYHHDAPFSRHYKRHPLLAILMPTSADGFGADKNIEAATSTYESVPFDHVQIRAASNEFPEADRLLFQPQQGHLSNWSYSLNHQNTENDVFYGLNPTGGEFRIINLPS